MGDPDRYFLAHGVLWDCTCLACPEQYDIFRPDSKEYIGYFRYRYGFLSVDDAHGHTILSAQIGDSYGGILEPDVREICMGHAAYAVFVMDLLDKMDRPDVREKMIEILKI